MSSKARQLSLKSFNGSLDQLLVDLQEYIIKREGSPNVALQTAIDYLPKLRKQSAMTVAIAWEKLIAQKYLSEIERHDVTFFLNKDYRADLIAAGKTGENLVIDQVLTMIDEFRRPMQTMDAAGQEMVMQRVAELTRLSVSIVNA